MLPSIAIMRFSLTSTSLVATPEQVTLEHDLAAHLRVRHPPFFKGCTKKPVFTLCNQLLPCFLLMETVPA